MAVVALGFLSSLAFAASGASAKGIEFKDVVKLIERHYGVKQQGLSFAARAGIKIGKIVVDRKTRYSEYGSVKFALFEDQDFSRPSGGVGFGAAMSSVLQPEWQPLVEVRSGQDAEQVFVYLKEAGKVFKVLVITLGERDGVAVQVDIKPDKLAQLLKNPDTAGKILTDEATEDSSPE
jgi:hypothetical protein